MTAALHLVPEPDDESPAPGVGEEYPVSAVPAAVEEPGEELAVDELGEEPAVEDWELDDDEPAPPRALTMPDLRPYASLTWIPAVINAGLAGARRRRQHAPDRKAARRAAKAQRRAAGEPTRRAQLWQMAADYLAGTRLLLGHLGAWIGGEHGPKDMTVPARMAAAGFAGYCAYRTVTTWPQWGVIGLSALWCCGALGALHKERAKTRKQTAKKADKTVPKTAAQPLADTPTEALAEAVAEAPAEDAVDSPAEAVEEAAAEPPAPPSREAIAEALHHLYRGGSGVLLTTLRKHLSLPHTRAVREVLHGAGIRVREGVRTPGGNGPGVHAHDFPPPPPSPDLAPGTGVVAGDSANANANNAESGPKKGLRADGSYWPEGKPYHFEPDPANPHGTLIVYHEGDRA
ncbi:hypothetical protein ABZ499_32960 [Streptomyces sp. NPDC019990]|uniref:hypothetical protein n=1 Tax=Streptomyces sp. NPDC019990 TaxID=3154693 RepID=UPI003404BF19